MLDRDRVELRVGSVGELIWGNLLFVIKTF